MAAPLAAAALEFAFAFDATSVRGVGGCVPNGTPGSSTAGIFTVKPEQLKVSLFAKAELIGSLDGTEPFALAFDEHGQTCNDEVIWTNRKFTGRANDA